MDYTDDPCVWEFTEEQIRRMRCTLEHWRPSLWTTSAGCGLFTNYCTPGVSAVGCKARVRANGTPSASASAGFEVRVERAEGGKQGVFYFGTQGAQANTWGNGSSFQCVTPPVARTPTQVLSGAAGACSGTAEVDLNSIWCSTCPKAAKNPGPGATAYVQFWYRDPQNTSNQTTSLSNAASFLVCP
jgi:hypothetical protein